MPDAAFTEAVVEEAALAWLEGLGYVAHTGPDLGPGGPDAERADARQVVLERRLTDALARLNPHLPPAALADARRQLLAPEGASLVARNHAVHRLMVDGVPVQYRRDDGAPRDGRARVLDFDAPDRNDWLAVRQLTVVDDVAGVRHTRRPDVVLYVNGLPLVVVELKNAADEDADVAAAIRQLQTYKAELPTLFTYNVALVASDGLHARVGTLTADRERFMPWRTVAGDRLAEPSAAELQVLLEGAFDRRRFLDLVRHFVVFEQAGAGEVVKKMAGYHQFHAVNVAVAETLRAAATTDEEPAAPDRVREGWRGRYGAGARPGGAPGDRRVGVVWHTQGSGKSLTMAFYAGRLVRHPALRNPTVVVVTDRNDLDDQLFGVFARCKELFRQDPVQAANRADLRERLAVQAGGVVFTTVQKFLPDAQGDRHPVLSARRNIVVIADEAHRSQYDFVDGFAAHLRDALPGAAFVGFTGTPIEADDRSTRAVFGDYISVYDVQRAVDDGATVPIYYEGRFVRLGLREEERPHIDPGFEEVTEGEEVERRAQLLGRWGRLEAVVGAEPLLQLVAEDVVRHFEARLEVIDGKAMVVCMSRRICVELYDRIVALRPAWRDEDDARGAVKVVMTGSASDPLAWQRHVRSKAARERLADRFRDPADPLRMVIVRDMWLTGFDAPALHTLYVHKPMRGHGLMQAIARVNRVYRDKPGGLVVDYFGLADQLRQALDTYTESGGGGEAAVPQEEAVRELRRAYEVCAGIFHGFDRRAWASGTAAERLALLPLAQEHVLAQEDGRARFDAAVGELSRWFAVAVPDERALALRDDVGFFQAVRAVLLKHAPSERRSDEALDHAVRQIVSRSVAADGIVDLFAAAGLRRPEVSVLSEQFLGEVQRLPQRHVAIEVLRKLLGGEVAQRRERNVVQAESFEQRLSATIRRYQNRTIDTARVLEELLALASDMRAAAARGEALGLTSDELAFYDALGVDDTAVRALGEPTLKAIAQELVQTVRRNVTIDWTVRENVRAQLRVLVKRVLRRHGYPPGRQEKATHTVLQQAEALSANWALQPGP